VREEDLKFDQDEMKRQMDEIERKLKEEKQNEEFLPNNEHLGLTEKQIHEFEEATKVKTVEFIEFGKHRVETWYFSPFPREYHCSTLYICEFCLNFFVHKAELIRHTDRCMVRYPPGDEIYRDDSVSVFEVDAKNQQTYCENLCLISKLFLDHKTLHYDIDPFYFYVLCEHDAMGYHLVGYFSREKGNADNNLSCILVMPFCQRKGYGKFIVEFSYALSLKEGKSGSPEKPLSDLGHRLYTSWWTQTLLKILLDLKDEQISI
jgi:GNAT superfamily N-acetyltransferase